MNGLIVRTMPAGLRNGLPGTGAERTGYTYRGTGEDIMPWAVTDDDSVADEELTGILGRRRSPRWQPSRDRCVKCGYLYRSAKHHELCKGAAGKCDGCGYRLTSVNHRSLCGEAA